MADKKVTRKKQPRLGTGGRSKKMKKDIVAEYMKKGKTRAEAEEIAGKIIGKQGRAVHGKKKMAKWSAKGRKRNSKKG